ncbi:MAG: 3-phosphoshikimate 1-carboxyvinyltransferase [Candidatus Omnitrophica bacterium]|nr:3-phosphoshikimate 1-carboxyvinyltransferase [Candidatus Omnitrophota bacterium]
MKSVFSLRHTGSAQGKILLPGDKSIAHRFLLVSSLSRGTTVIENFPANKDCLATLAALRKLGAGITRLKNNKISAIKVSGKGLNGLNKPRGDVFVGDSGTTLRLLLGVLAGQPFRVKLTAGRSLSRRPMRRVTRPLRMMGAYIKTKIKSKKAKVEEYPPITIKGGDLKGITYRIPVASAQVKSAILLAGLYASGETEITESTKTRDHTERVLRLAGACVRTRKNKVRIRGIRELILPPRLFVPGDISSASFFMVLAAILPDSKIIIKNVSLNPSRLGIVKVLKRMGARILTTNDQPRLPLGTRGGHGLTTNDQRLTTKYEPMGDIIVESSKLRGVVIKKKEIPSLIDELPILMVAASCANKITVFEGVSELRVKETDRIRSMSYNLKQMGVSVRVIRKNGGEDVVVEGAPELKGARIRSFNDHRTAMSMIVAGLAAGGKSVIDDVSCIDKSFPEFLPVLKSIIK